MLQIAVLREQTDQVIAGLLKKNYKNAVSEVASILDLDQRRRMVQAEHDEVQARANALAREIGGLMKSDNKAGAEQLKSETAELKNRTRQYSEELSALEENLQAALVKLPNTPHASVPVGKTPE